MKLLIATDAAPPQISGVVSTLQAIKSEIEKRGYMFRTIDPPMFPSMPAPGYPEVPLSFPRGIKNMIEEYDPDAVHICTEGPIGFATSWHCRKMNIPYTTSYATHFSDLIKQKYYIPTTLTWRFLRWHHNNAVRTLVSTDAVKEELNQLGIYRVESWGKGVDTNLFNSSYRNTIMIPYEHPLWLFVGRMSLEKNLEDFLRLDLPGAKVCIGCGPELDKYISKYPGVNFLGAITGKRLAEWHANADVFVFPSKWDTFGMVMVESASCGTPVAAYPVRGPLQAVKHGVTGYLGNDLKTACLHALSMDRHRAEEYTHKHFDWSVAVDRFLKNLEVRKNGMD